MEYRQPDRLPASTNGPHTRYRGIAVDALAMAGRWRSEFRGKSGLLCPSVKGKRSPVVDHASERQNCYLNVAYVLGRDGRLRYAIDNEWIISRGPAYV
jgi:hypothetical protein